MRIEIDDKDQSLFIQMIRTQREGEAARTGLHLSTIVNDIADRQGKPDREGIDESTGMSFQELGNAIEDVIAWGLQARFPGWNKPMPRTDRGIICSPDGHSPRANCIDEVKARWGSCREFLELDGEWVSDFAPRIGELTSESPKFLRYRMQTMYYMEVWKAIRGRIHILFLAGDFRPPFPKPVTIRLRPTDRELGENYYMIRQHAVDMGLLKAKEL